MLERNLISAFRNLISSLIESVIECTVILFYLLVQSEETFFPLGTL